MNTEREELTFDYDEIQEETHKSWLLRIDRDRIWLPKSKCEIDKEEKTIYVPQWLAEEKGLI